MVCKLAMEDIILQKLETAFFPHNPQRAFRLWDSRSQFKDFIKFAVEFNLSSFAQVDQAKVDFQKLFLFFREGGVNFCVVNPFDHSC